jgi:anti-sigma regulatory factor (Ser/Thr protein kinase)
MTSPDGARAPQSTPVTGSVSVDLAFAEPDLFRLRAEVAAHVAMVGDEDLIHRVLIVSSELATNAVRHGGGSGRLRLWTDGQVLVCEVSDTGAGITDPNPGADRPDPMARGGRGIWFARQLADRFDLITGASGTTATASFRLGSRA